MYILSDRSHKKPCVVCNHTYHVTFIMCDSVIFIAAYKVTMMSKGWKLNTDASNNFERVKYETTCLSEEIQKHGLGVYAKGRGHNWDGLHSDWCMNSWVSVGFQCLVVANSAQNIMPACWLKYFHKPRGNLKRWSSTKIKCKKKMILKSF